MAYSTSGVERYKTMTCSVFERYFCTVLAGACFISGVVIGANVRLSATKPQVTVAGLPSATYGVLTDSYVITHPAVEGATTLPLITTNESSNIPDTIPAPLVRPNTNVWCSTGNCTLGSDGVVHCMSDNNNTVRIETPRGPIPSRMPEWRPPDESSHYRPEDYVPPSTP